MILLSEQQYVPTVDGDLSQVQQKTLFSDGTSQAIAFLVFFYGRQILLIGHRKARPLRNLWHKIYHCIHFAYSS